jgi:Domain of unknown function (DUF1844)
MSDKPGLQIDDDWKRQAQEEKRKLAEQQKAAEPKAVPAAPERKKRELPDATFDALVQSFASQAMYYLGEYAGPDGEPMVDLDLAKHQIDLVTLLETKCKGNLSGPEQGTLDSMLYELRMRYVSIATQLIR